MKKMYFTVTGINYRYGTEFLNKGDIVRLVKEPENEYDKEAIKVEMEGLGQIGYVANSWRTVIGESFSAGRLYDKIPEVTYGTILHVLKNDAIGMIETEHTLDQEINYEFGE
ncbi:MAG: HIRAN domain-containing protein [Solobacterium sp.]|nr:HIRAN domain-containing protein [Solobacterium sp.]